MPDNLPTRRISREALERIIQRAAELQAGELDAGEGLTEQDLLKLGAEVGIDGRFLRQALYEETAGGGAESERGLLARLAGPRLVRASRVVPGDKVAVEDAMAQWMTEGEALSVKRRLPDRTVWERQRGFFAEMKRGFGVGGKAYQLARALDVAVIVTQLEQGFCHVELVADVSPARSGFLAGGGAVAGLFLLFAATAAAAAAPVATPIVAAAAGLGFGGLLARQHRRAAQRTHVALEQVLDRLEHGEIRPRHQLAGPRASAFVRIADEIRRAITDVADAPHRGPRRLPPNTDH